MGAFTCTPSRPRRSLSTSMSTVSAIAEVAAGQSWVVDRAMRNSETTATVRARAACSCCISGVTHSQSRTNLTGTHWQELFARCPFCRTPAVTVPHTQPPQTTCLQASLLAPAARPRHICAKSSWTFPNPRHHGFSQHQWHCRGPRPARALL